MCDENVLQRPAEDAGQGVIVGSQKKKKKKEKRKEQKKRESLDGDHIQLPKTKTKLSFSPGKLDTN